MATFGETYARIHVINCARSLDDALTAGDLVEGGIILAPLRETVRALPADPGSVSE